ncbi:MFS transporter [Kitasatospora sp. NPDC028055]|uniref:MFS transporter n=1 Tax=Kitasatospora sp. NPDC028055 TaxID=3155653 RepID=UPI0033C15A55
MASGRTVGYFALRSIGWLVDNLLVFGIPLLCYRVTGGLTWSGLAVVLTWTPRLLSLAGAGYLVDRLSIRQIFLVSDAGRLALAAVCCLLILLRPSTAVPVVLVFGMLSGAFFEQTFVAGEKAGRLLTPPERAARTQSVLTGLEQAAIIAGPALGGLLLLFPPVVFVATAGAGYAVSLLLALALPEGRADPDAAPSPLAGLRRTVRDPVLRSVVLLTMGLNYLLSLLIGSAPALVATRYGVSESALGFVYSAAGVASIAVVGIAPWLIGRLGLWRYGIGLALASALVCLGLSAAPDLALFGVALGVFLALDSLFSVYLRTTRAERVPTGEFGSAVAAFGLLLVAPMPVAGATLALAGSSVDPATLLRVASVGVLVLTLALLPGLARAGRPTPADRPTPAGPHHPHDPHHHDAGAAPVAHEREDIAR